MKPLRATPCRPARFGVSAWERPKPAQGSIGLTRPVDPAAGLKTLNQPTPPRLSRERTRRRTEPLHPVQGIGWRPKPARGRIFGSDATDGFRQTGAGLGIPVLVALCGGLLGRNTRGGTIVVGALNLGGSIEMISNAVRIAELAIDKQAQTSHVSSARRQLNDLPDDLWTKISIELDKDGADAVFKALME